MTKAIRVHETGGPEVLSLEDVELGEPGAGEVRLRHTAIGLNYIDVYFRTGSYPAQLPFTPGFEAAGVVEAVGDGVTGLTTGDRVAYAAQPIGAYTESRLILAERSVKLPDAIEDRIGAAIMLKGMTPHLNKAILVLKRATMPFFLSICVSFNCNCFEPHTFLF